MMILITTDETIDHSEAMSQQIDTICRSSLRPFADHITRVEFSLRTGPASDDAVEWRCTARAHYAGNRALGTLHRARTAREAYEGAAAELRKMLCSEDDAAEHGARAIAV